MTFRGWKNRENVAPILRLNVGSNWWLDAKITQHMKAQHAAEGKMWAERTV